MGSEKDLAAAAAIATEIDAAAIDAVIEKLMKTAGAPGAAVAAVRGDAVYVRGYGVKEKGKDDPVTPDTVFACASTTKAMTTASMALLVGEGHMAWDDPVRKYLPQFRLSDPLADACVTVRDLVCHRTGLPRHDMLWYRSPWDTAEVLRRIGFAKLSATFRQKYQYQNVCFLAAGEAARAAAGAESWEAFVTERLLAPLGMTSTSLRLDGALNAPDHATPHKRLKGKIKPSPWLNFDSIAPAGTMNSCAADLAKWVRFQLAGGVLPDGTRLIAEAALRETRTPQTIIPQDDDSRARYPESSQWSYGLGWTLWTFRGGHAVVSHAGAIDGFRAQVALVPSLGVGVAVLVNVGLPFAELARNAVLDVLLDLPPGGKDWNAELKADLAKMAKQVKDKEKERRTQRENGQPSPAPLAAYAGEYDDPAYGTVTVTKSGAGKKAGLVLRWNQFESPLRHQTFSSFLTATDDEDFAKVEVKFRLGPTGEVESLALFDGEFARVKKAG